MVCCMLGARLYSAPLGLARSRRPLGLDVASRGASPRNAVPRPALVGDATSCGGSRVRVFRRVGCSLTVGVPSRVPAFFPRLSPLGASSFRASADASIAYTAGDRASVSARARGPGGQVPPEAEPGESRHDARARGAARERRTRANATDPPRPRVVHNRHRRGHRSYHAGARAYERGRRRIRVHDDDTRYELRR